MPSRGCAVALPISHSGKLSRVDRVAKKGGYHKFRLVQVGPRVSATHVSIQATCPDSCAFKGKGCYSQEGFEGLTVRKLDAKVRDHKAVAMDEAWCIDQLGKRGVPQDGGRGGTNGRDLRIHTFGDVRGSWHAALLAHAALQYRRRGGGRVWTYTHRWREVPIEDWGIIQALASVDSIDEIPAATERGYAPALVLPELPDKPFEAHGVRMIPCPNEIRGVTCVQCRLCLDHDMRGKRLGVVFGVHGRGAKKRLPLAPSFG